MSCGPLSLRFLAPKCSNSGGLLTIRTCEVVFVGKAKMELSVVMPCLNEADTLATCISKALETMREHGIHGEVVVADNGSSDGSQQIAEDLGARVVHVAEKGYGQALMGGIEASRGRYIIMGDADDSYDFLEIPRFVEKLREDYDLVMGCRLPGGNGSIIPGAMPFLHRWLGNPVFSFMARHMFRAPIHDVYCGFRGLTRDLYDRLDLRCAGMEFATEMVIKSSLFGVRIAETPITLHRDGRKSHAPHLRTFSDGWRTLRFFMLYSPEWLYLAPAVALLLAGLAGYAIVMPGHAVLGPHTLLVSSLSVLMGFQAILFLLLAKVFATGDGLLPPSRRLEAFFKFATLEKGLVLSTISFLVGLGLVARVAWHWWRTDFAPLDYGDTMRLVIPGITLAALGSQCFMGSCFVSILGMRRR